MGVSVTALLLPPSEVSLLSPSDQGDVCTEAGAPNGARETRDFGNE